MELDRALGSERSADGGAAAVGVRVLEGRWSELRGACWFQYLRVLAPSTESRAGRLLAEGDHKDLGRAAGGLQQGPGK